MMGQTTTRSAMRVALACCATSLLLAVALTACSADERPAAAGPSASARTSLSAGSAAADPASPVESRVEGEDYTMAEYRNTLVGLSFRYSAAEMVLMDDAATLESNGLTKGSQAALCLGYMGDGGALMWIIATRTPAHARKDSRTLAGFASTLARAVDDCARARLEDGSEARSLGVRRISRVPVYGIERRGVEKNGTYAGSPVRFRCFGLATRQHAFIIIQEVGPARFVSRFRGFDRVLETVRIGDAVGA